MKSSFSPVADTKTLEELLARSQNEPVLLFKHSTTCPISAAAHREVEELGGDVPIIVVQRSRDISREVETRTGVRHETPQALVLRRGEVVWSASHWHITADALKQALKENE
ncbi:MAG: bacillithiol system redox-active protein YtxJ [Acidobacteria bacterium]|nr:bacillithiol system redox-active protein YtxJ [Acidobacteriota bacterium]